MGTVQYYGCYDHSEEWYLVELALDIPASEIRWDQIYVPEHGVKRESWQVPYMEQYLNGDGTEKLCETYETPKECGKSCRVAFFLYKGPARTLSTPYGDLELRSGGQVPKRLEGLIEFEGY